MPGIRSFTGKRPSRTTLILWGALLIYLFGYADIKLNMSSFPWHVISLKPFVFRSNAVFVLQFIQHFINIDIGILFRLLEFGALLVLFVALQKIAKIWLQARAAFAGAFVFLALLVPPYFLAHFFHPYFPSDTLSITFLALGLLFILQKRWILTAAVMILGTWNRETIILLPIFALSYYFGTKGYLRVILWSGLLVLLYVFFRYVSLAGYSSLPGSIIDIEHGEQWRIVSNLRWVVEHRDYALIFFNISALPLFWAALYKYVPHQWNLTRIPIALFFLLLMIVGNIHEPRIFGEVMLLMYIPVLLGAKNWMTNTVPVPPGKEFPSWGKNITTRLNSLPIVTIFICITILAYAAFTHRYPTPPSGEAWYMTRTD
jgi:hypothetical protein